MVEQEFNLADMVSIILSEKRKLKKEHKNPNQNKYCTAEEAILNIKCKDCSSIKIKEINGYYTCLECGLLNDTIIDSCQDWRYYGHDDHKSSDPARCDMITNELLPKTSMGSLVGWGGKQTATTKRVRNMKQWNSITYKDSTLLETFNNITILAQNSGLNQCIIEEAKHMYKRISEVKSSRRTKKEGMKAGSIALACKLKGVPRNCDEIAKICHLKNNKTLRKSIKTFEEIWIILQSQDKPNFVVINSDTDDSTDSDSSFEDNQPIVTSSSNTKKFIVMKSHNTSSNLDMDTNTDSDSDSDSDTHTHSESDKVRISVGTKSNSNMEQNVIDIKKPVLCNKTDSETETNSEIEIDVAVDNKYINEYVTKLHRFTSVLNLDDKVFNACKKILIYIEKENYLDKHNPLSKLSAIIYYVGERLNVNVNKHSIMRICGVSDVTINKCYQKLMKNKDILNKINLEK